MCICFMFIIYIYCKACMVFQPISSVIDSLTKEVPECRGQLMSKNPQYIDIW